MSARPGPCGGQPATAVPTAIADNPSDLRSDRKKVRRATSGEAPDQRDVRNCFLNPIFEYGASKIGVRENGP
jgi:hypothetical protein